MGSQQQQKQQQHNTTTTTTNNNNKTPPTTTITGNCTRAFVGSNYKALILNIREEIRREYKELHNEEFHNLCFIKWYFYSQER